MSPASASKLDLGALVVVGLRLAGWLLTNALCSLGVIALLAFAIGSFNLSGTMLQLANLSTRFVSADADRQGQFAALLLSAITIVFVFTAILRRHSAAAALRSPKGPQ